MDIEKVKEDLSICYIKAISAINEIALEVHSHDEDSTDVELKRRVMINNRPFDSNVHVQLKATSSTSQYSEDDSSITYKLKAKNYNDLCTDSSTPRILALLVLPEVDWVNCTLDELLLRGRMYWFSLYGKNQTINTSTVSVNIPKSNVLNDTSVIKLMQKAAEEGRL